MPDLLHVCFGGVGGHRSVVTGLAGVLAPLGISTGVVAIAPPKDLLDGLDDWPAVERLWPLPLTRRGDLGSMAGTLQALREADARAVLVHTHRHALPALAGALGQGGHRRLVTVEHTTHAGRYPLATANLAVAAAASAAVVYLTEASRAASPIRRLPIPSLSRAVVIPNGIDPARYAREEPLRAPDGEPVIGMATRLVPGKDVAGLVQAVALLVGQGRPVRLVVAGEGADREGIAARADELGVADRVDLLGRVGERDMPAFLASLDVYVQATDGETLSMSMLEAAATGVPMVASRVSGIAGTFDDAALLVPPRDPQALAAGIAAVLDDPVAASARVRAARELVDRRYTSSRMAARYLDLLGGLDPAGPWRAASARLP